MFGRLHTGRDGARALLVAGHATSAASAGKAGPQTWNVRYVRLWGP